MKHLILFPIALWGMVACVNAGKLGDDLMLNDIEKSTKRIENAFHLNLQKDSILEQKTPVGQVSFEKDEFYVTYRPSLGMEIINCVDKSPLPLGKVNLLIPGSGHKGLTQLFSIENVNETVIKPFIEYKKKTQVPTEKATIFIEGFSAGAHRAIETATYLKQRDDTKNHNLVVLRYAGATTFDDIAVDEIHSLLDKKNILDFHAKGDSIAAFLNMENVKKSLGTSIEFSAESSEDYKKRVSAKAYSHLDPSLKSMIPLLDNPLGQIVSVCALTTQKIPLDVINFLKPEVWELHQPVIYTEFCPNVFATLKKK